MSIKVPKETVEYQSHHNCQCDFCNSRRNVNAKNWTISQRAAMVKHAKQQNGCCCTCHDALNGATFAKDRSGFCSGYPAPVDQTALNAANGRNGVPEGNQFTIPNSTTRGTAAANAGGHADKTPEEEARDAAKDLERLERLLIMEHKARVKASLEADKLGTLRNSGKENRPQPIPAGYTGSGYGNPDASGMGNANSGNTYRGDSMYPGASYDGVDAATVREAYRLAHECPVTPPPQCRASHRLQDTVNGIRGVTMDPINRGNRAALQNVLSANDGAAMPGEIPSSVQRGKGDDNAVAAGPADQENYEFGNSLARNVNSMSHPVGAGVVWTDSKKKAATADLTPGAAAAVSVANNNNNSGNTKGVKFGTL